MVKLEKAPDLGSGDFVGSKPIRGTMTICCNWETDLFQKQTCMGSNPLVVTCPSSPTGEATDLNPVQCGFESHGGYIRRVAKECLSGR